MVDYMKPSNALMRVIFMIELLSKIQKELNAPKGQYNSFGKYSYRSCEDILNAVKPFLINCTLVITDEVVFLGDRFYVKATATLSDGKQHIEGIGWAREALDKKGMDESQITGAASSYARKYALNGLFCIDDSKDADTDEQKNQVDSAPNWYNDFEKQKETMVKKIQSGEQTNQGIVDSLKKAGFAISKETKNKIMELK